MCVDCQFKAEEERRRGCVRGSRAYDRRVSGSEHKEGGAGQKVQRQGREV